MILARISIEGIEEREIQKTDETCRCKTPSPAEIHQQETQQGYSNRRSKFGRGVKHGGCQAAFIFGEPVTGGFRIGWECRSLTNLQKEARPKQTSDARGDGRSKGGHTPNHGADNAYAADAKAIQQQSGRQLEQRVGPVVSA